MKYPRSEMIKAILEIVAKDEHRIRSEAVKKGIAQACLKRNAVKQGGK
ncbi:MAG: hypothetical protein WD467_00050 [Candidatus Saccharimonadales bacterium]